MLIGIVGKPNSGKTTFFNAATALNAKTADYPFTTIEPNVGVGYASIDCVCREFNVEDNPQNSICLNGTRFIPVKLIDVAGLVPGAWQGRGMGNQFLDNLRQADVLIHVVDASGSFDSDGRPLGKPGSWDPLKDIAFLEEEIARWIFQIIKRDWERSVRRVEVEKKDLITFLASRLSGLSITYEHVSNALSILELDINRPTSWGDEDLYLFSRKLREISKPILIAANKIDIPAAEENYMRIREAGYPVVPVSAIAELALIRYSEKGLIRYVRGSKDFDILQPEKLNVKEKKLFSGIKQVLDKWGSTGIQETINKAVFELGNMIAVYPVEDLNKLSDKKGNVLPDTILVRRGTTAREFAGKIHSDLEKTFLYAVDARTKKKLGEDYIVQHKDVLKIVAAAKRK